LTRIVSCFIFAATIPLNTNEKMMIRTLCLLITTIPLFLQAQYYQFEAGYEAGPALGKYWSNSMSPKHFITDVNYSQGFFFKYHIKRNWSVQTGFYQDVIGTHEYITLKNILGEPTGRATLRREVDYITLPLMVRYTFGNRFRTSFTAGTFFGYAMQHRLETDFGDHVETTDMSNQINRFNTGIILGAGIEYSLFKQCTIGVDMRDQLGLANLDPKNSLSYFHTNSLQLLIRVSYRFGYVFPIEKKLEVLNRLY
jgi:hypothetical protein